MSELPLWHEQPELDFDEWLPLRQQLQNQIEQPQRTRQQQAILEGSAGHGKHLTEDQEAAVYAAYFKRKRDGTA